MYKIKTPNKNYNATTYGIKFENGHAEVADEQIKNILINDYKYELVEDEDKSTKKKTSKRED